MHEEGAENTIVARILSASRPVCERMSHVSHIPALRTHRHTMCLLPGT